MRKRKKNRSSLLVVLLFIFLLFSIVIFGVISLISAPSREKATFIKVDGDFKTTLKLLEEKNVIKNADFAYIYAKFFKGGSNLIAGNFEVPPNLSLGEVLDYLSNNENMIKNETVTLTFIEGDWAKHIARKISENTNVTYDELMEYWNDLDSFKELQKKYSFLKNDIYLSKPKILLEGYLSPNTYEFYRNTTKEEVTKKLLDQTDVIYKKYIDDFKNKNIGIKDIFTMASIIQYESGNNSEMPTVASVFYNRLERGMRLESSATRCYVVGFEKGDNWRNCEVNLDHFDPYDTYQANGLPPGPIVNPSEEAIKAALFPAKTDYLYFVGDLENKNYFSKTLQEHEKNICKYLTKTCE